MVKRTRMEFITGEVYQKILVSNLFDKILGIVFSDGKFEEIPLVERYSDIEFLFKYLHKQEVSSYLVSIAGQLLFDSNACFKRELSKLIYDNIFSCLTFVDFEQEVDDVGFCIPNLFFSTHTTVKYLGSTEPLDLDSSSLFYKTYAKTIKGNSAKIYRTTSQQGGVEVERMYMVLPKEPS